MASRNLRKLRAKKKINFDKHVLTVYRSNKNILAQVLAPKTKQCIFSTNSQKLSGSKTEKSIAVGKIVSQFLKEKNINSLSFYRNGYLYHGRVKALVDSVREEGIEI